MTAYYRVLPADGYEWVAPVRPSDFEAIEQLASVQSSVAWEPISVESIGGDGQVDALRADLPWLAANVLVLRQPARRLLASILGPAGALLPLNTEGDLWIFCPRYVDDALDEDGSDISRFPSSGRIMAVRRYVLRKEAVGGVDAFRFAQLPQGPIIVSQRVVDAVQSAGLTGITFKSL